MSVQNLLARPVDNLSTEGKAAVVQQCIGKPSASTSWLPSDLLGHLWMIGIPLLALLARLDGWLLWIIWTLAVTSFFLSAILSAVDPDEAAAGDRLTEDELRSAVHHLLAQPVDDWMVEAKAEAIRDCLLDMKRKAKHPWWSRAVEMLPGYFLPFAGVATIAALFPGIAWYLWLGLGGLFGVVVAVLLALGVRGTMWLVKPAGRPSETKTPSS